MRLIAIPCGVRSIRVDCLGSWGEGRGRHMFLYGFVRVFSMAIAVDHAIESGAYKAGLLRASR